MTPATAHSPGTINPADGSALDPVPATAAKDIRGAVEAARLTQPGWASITLKDRSKLLMEVAERVLDRRKEILEIISLETGKSESEALVNEVSLIVAYAKTAAKVAKVALADDNVAISALDYPGKKAVVEAIPRGVIGIIAPWNYPLGNFFKPLFPALLAGNGVVLKPSEHTPRSGAWLAKVAGGVLPRGLVQVVQGGGEVGAALLEAGIDGVTFTGSVATGRRVAAKAGELLIPCSVELGGKDAAIVLADCDLERTSVGVAQWAIHNTGQNCAAIERVYVEAAIADAFVKRLSKVVGALRVAPSSGCTELGPLQNAAQLAIVEDHVADAIASGAKLVVGGKRTGNGYGYLPTVLDNCSQAMKVVREETFGPVIAVVRVQDAEEALAMANDSEYGLNGSVWTGDLKRGEALARRLDVGVALVNNHAITGTMANVPWTGTKNTGPGVAGSRFSYNTFVRRRTVFVDSSNKPDPWWFPANDDLTDFGEAIVARSLGSMTVLIKLAGLVGKRVKAIRELGSV